MILLIIVAVLVIAFELMYLAKSKQLEHEILYMMSGFVILMAATGNALAYSGIANTTVVQVFPATDTIYLNNGTGMTLYVTSTAAVKGWVGNTMSSMVLVMNSTPVGGVSIIPGNKTMTLDIPNGLYYKFNYSTARFVEVQSS
jgi:hypothetical protein